TRRNTNRKTPVGGAPNIAGHKATAPQSKPVTLGPARPQAGADFGGYTPLLGILEFVDDKQADDLPHFVARLRIMQIRFPHREGERLFNWNGQPKPFFLVTHYGKSKSETWVRRRARF